MTISLQRRRRRLKLLLVTTFCVAIFAGFKLYRQYENPFTFLVEFGKSLPWMGFVVAYFILPLFGFPVSVFLIVAGIRFGFLGGMLVAASGMLFHHVIAFRVVHGWLRSILISRLERAGYRVPFFRERNQICYTALFAAVHGPPYIAKVYLLALTNVNFRVYLCVGAPVYIAFCAIPVGVGSSFVKITPLWIYGALFLITLIPIGSRWMVMKYRKWR